MKERPKHSNSSDRSLPQVKELPTESIAADPMNIRGAPKLDEEFMNSIKKGIIEPLIVRSVNLVEDKKVREELLSQGKQFVVTAGVRRYEAALHLELKNVPCIVRELSDLKAMALSLVENIHRKDIPPWRKAEIVRNFYDKLKDSKEERIATIHDETNMSRSSIQNYLLFSELPDGFTARLKEPEERSFSEKEALSKMPILASEETAPFDESGKETPPFEPSQVPVGVMVKLAQDKDFRKLIRKDPAKAHELATTAAEKGQERVGEVLRTIREHPKAEVPPRPPVAPPVYITVKIALTWDELDALERYRQMHGIPDLPAAASSGVHKWIVQKSGKKWMDLEAASRSMLSEILERERCFKTEGR